MFEIKNGELHYKDKPKKPLTHSKRKLSLIGEIENILDKKVLRALGFDLPKGGVTHQQVVALNKAIEELPSTSDVDNVDVIELQEYVDNIDRSAESLIDQLEGEFS